jgi:hypothetical protein
MSRLMLIAVVTLIISQSGCSRTESAPISTSAPGAGDAPHAIKRTAPKIDGTEAGSKVRSQ